jgi:hypothetical protein
VARWASAMDNDRGRRLSLREAVEWCGSRLTLPEIIRLRRLYDGPPERSRRTRRIAAGPAGRAWVRMIRPQCGDSSAADGTQADGARHVGRAATEPEIPVRTEEVDHDEPNHISSTTAAESPRNWARGCHSTEAVVELLIRARGGRLVDRGQRWLRADNRGITWLDAQVIEQYSHGSDGFKITSNVFCCDSRWAVSDLGKITSHSDRLPTNSSNSSSEVVGSDEIGSRSSLISELAVDGHACHVQRERREGSPPAAQSWSMSGSRTSVAAKLSRTGRRQ